MHNALLERNQEIDYKSQELSPLTTIPTKILVKSTSNTSFSSSPVHSVGCCSGNSRQSSKYSILMSAPHVRRKLIDIGSETKKKKVVYFYTLC